MSQLRFASLDYASKKKREVFLGQVEEIAPCMVRLESLILPRYSKSHPTGGRISYGKAWTLTDPERSVGRRRARNQPCMSLSVLTRSAVSLR
jgi:hypothetical protein